jgi:hypothetical protein
MSAMSNYLEQQLANHVFRTNGMTQVSNLHLALYTSAPSDSGGGTELSGNAYARASVSRADAQWTFSAGTISNTNTITFPTPTANWGTVTHFGIFDASTGGNLLFHGALTASKTVNNGDTVTFPAGQLQITFD